MPRLARRPSALALVLLLATAVRGQHPTRSECEARHPLSWGRPGKDVVWVPTPDAVVHALLTMAEVTPQDLVVDLGAGDGKIAIAAAKAPFGARSVGIEYDAELAELATCLAEAEGVADKVRIVQGDIFKEDFGPATVVTTYLLPHLNVCVRHRILALEPGTRVAAHQFSMADWEPDASAQVQGRNVYLWIVPARVDGTWDFRDRRGEGFSIELRQSFAKLSGEITRGRVREPLLSVTVRGRELRFTFDTAGVEVAFAGTVRGGEMTGALSTGEGRPAETVGTLRGALRAAPWAEMREGCGQYYAP